MQDLHRRFFWRTWRKPDVVILCIGINDARFAAPCAANFLAEGQSTEAAEGAGVRCGGRRQREAQPRSNEKTKSLKDQETKGPRA